jgi:predicted regulator of Ras-like GTPase activity (Roadblock/LC7/MglB family)
MAKLDQLIQQVRAELGTEFVATDVVGMDGLSIGGATADPNLDRSAIAARFAMVMKLASKVSDKLALGTVEDNLVTTDKVMILSRFLGDGAYYWGLAVTKEATLGTVRMTMNEYAPQLWDAIPR